MHRPATRRFFDTTAILAGDVGVDVDCPALVPVAFFLNLCPNSVLDKPVALFWPTFISL